MNRSYFLKACILNYYLWLWNHQNQQLGKFRWQNERAKHEVANDDEDFLEGSKVPPSWMVELVLAQLWQLVPELLNNKLHIFHIQSYIWKSNKQTNDEKLMMNHVLGLHLLFSFEQQ